MAFWGNTTIVIEVQIPEIYSWTNDPIFSKYFSAFHARHSGCFAQKDEVSCASILCLWFSWSASVLRHDSALQTINSFAHHLAIDKRGEPLPSCAGELFTRGLSLEDGATSYGVPTKVRTILANVRKQIHIQSVRCALVRDYCPGNPQGMAGADKDDSSPKSTTSASCVFLARRIFHH